MKLSTYFVLGIALHLGGCGVMQQRDDISANETAQSGVSTGSLDLIATDFVNALSQLQAVRAETTTVALQRSLRTDQFTQAMLYALQQAGYATRWVDDEGSDRLFQYRFSNELTAQNVNSDTYELAIGVVEMRRSYSTAGQQVQPLSPLYVRGTDASAIVLNDDIFAGQAQGIQSQPSTATSRQKARNTDDLQASRVNAVPLKPLAQIQPNRTPTLALQNSSNLQVPDAANPLNPIIGRAATGQNGASGALSLPLVALQREENVFALGSSNFEDILAGHRVVTEQILTFANDSMRLGDFNKRLVEQLVDGFDPATDVFSVIGCSMGPTAIRGGNAALALGRAGRVVEALRFAGVADSHILDEGCWAGDGSLENLPKRGVVLTLNREV